MIEVMKRKATILWGGVVLMGFGAIAALGLGVQSRDMLTEKVDILGAESDLQNREAAIIRELFFLESQKKQNFADLTQAEKAFLSAVTDVATQIDGDNALMSELLEASYKKEVAYIQEYKSNWAIARNSQRAIDRLSKQILAAMEQSREFGGFSAIHELRDRVFSATSDGLVGDAVDHLIVSISANLKSGNVAAINQQWALLLRHLEVYQSATQQRINAFQGFSSSPIKAQAAEVRAASAERISDAYRQGVWQTNLALLACVIFLALISFLVIRLRAALHRTSTEKERLDAAVRQRTQELEVSMEKVRRSAEAKTSFLANMSHEIRTPMNGVIGMTELLEETRLDDEQKSYVSTIKGSADALLTVINDILDFSKAESGKLSLSPSPFRLDGLLDSVTQLISVTARAKEVEVIYYYPPEMPTGFVGDEGQLRQVLMNIVGNAVKFTKAGYVTIDVQCTPHDDDAEIAIVIRDTGIGMPEHMLDKIFESFIQVDDSSRREFEGTGLGLAISKRIVETMGGSIDVASELGVGSTFTIRFRLPTASVDKIESTSVMDLAAIPKMKILVVDDIELNRRIIEKRFAYYGHTIVSAESGATALEILSDGKHEAAPFDVAFLDYQMPKMDGLELAAKIRERKTHDGLPLIMLSSVTGIAEHDEYKSINKISALHKPATTLDLSLALQKALGLGSGGAQALTDSSDKLDEKFGEGAEILLAEDTKTNQVLIQRICEKAGFSMRIANDGAEAVAAFRKKTPDIVLMDWSMPVMNGLDATRAIRDMELAMGAPATPIIGLSANAMKEHEEQGIAAGMDAYLTKPVKKNDILRSLRSFCKTKAQAGDLQAQAGINPEGCAS